MNIEAALPEVGTRVLAEQAGVRDDLARLVGMWQALLESSGGPMLFGRFSIADAFFAPVVMRLNTYRPPLPAPISAYLQRVTALPGIAAWITDALAEHDFLDFEEPYRSKA
jgi:glutathione S-transferase